MIFRITHSLVLFLMQQHLVYSDSTGGCHGNSSEVIEKTPIENSKLSHIHLNFQKEEFPDDNPKRSSNTIDLLFNESYTFYDKAFWIILICFILYVVYVRARTNYRMDYPDESGSPFLYAIVNFRKMIAPDPYLDPEMKEEHLSSSFNNGPLIAFWILWYSIGFFSLNEMFGVTYDNIEGLTELMIALFIYFINIVGCCVVYDTCVSAPMKYYEE